MRLITRFFTIISLFFFIQLAEAKSIVVLLDNSASMKKQQGEDFSQCDASLFSIQLILSTQNKNDDIYVIPAYRNNEKVQVLKNPTIEEIKVLTCYNASIYRSLQESLSLASSIEEDNKELILIGDGEWFIEGDQLDVEGKSKLVRELVAISKHTKIWYLNTSSTSNENNKFLPLITVAEKEHKNITILDTDNKSIELLKSFDLVTKSLLNTPNVEQQFVLDDNQLTIATDLPNEDVFVLIQSFEKPYSGKVLSVNSPTNPKLIIKKNIVLTKGDIFGGLYAVKNYEGLIKPGEINFVFDSPVPRKSKISVYYNPGIKIQEPVFSGKEGDILSFKDNEYRVCQDLAEFPLEYNLRDKFNKTLSHTPTNVIIEIRDVNGKTVSVLKGEKSLYKTSIKLNKNLKKEAFVFYVKLGQSFEDEIPIRISKSPCIEMAIDAKSLVFNHHLPDSFSEEIAFPFIYDKKTKKQITEEQEYITYKIDGDTTNYKVSIADKITIFKSENEESEYCQCVRVSSVKNLTIAFSHPNLSEETIYTIKIKQTDEPFYKRCLKFIIALILLLLLLIYWLLLKRKKTFYRKRKRRAKITKYVDGAKRSDKYLSGNLLNRLNPFIVEKDKVYGLSFTAAASQCILIKVSSLKSKARDRTIYKYSDGRRYEVNIPENKKYVYLMPGSGFEFGDRNNSERLIYEISRKN